jgi:hypothetical protein
MLSLNLAISTLPGGPFLNPFTPRNAQELREGHTDDNRKVTWSRSAETSGQISLGGEGSASYGDYQGTITISGSAGVAYAITTDGPSWPFPEAWDQLDGIDGYEYWRELLREEITYFEQRISDSEGTLDVSSMQGAAGEMFVTFQTTRLLKTVTGKLLNHGGMRAAVFIRKNP